jgi:hypothetical protein
MKKKFIKYIIFFFLLLLIFFYFLSEKKKQNEINNLSKEKDLYSTNIMKDVNYVSKDSKGNEYIIDAKKGEIDITNSNIIFLTDVVAYIKLVNKDVIKINSKYGKYNIINYNTIFNENVIINYIDNKIKSEYLDFSLERNSMIISKNVVYTNLENVLKADIIEMNIETKDTKIFMHNNNKKVNIKSIN